MTGYWMWDPHVPADEPRAVQLVLTPDEAGDPPTESASFFQTMLNDLGVDASIERWNVVPFRSTYYTDYGDSDDWRDRWPLVWRVRLVTNRRLAEPSLETRETYTEPEETSGIENLEGPDEVGCLVVADFRTEDAIAEARTAILEDEELRAQRERGGLVQPQFHETRILAQYSELQVDLGLFPRDFFRSGADYAQAVLSVCKRKRGTICFDERG